MVRIFVYILYCFILYTAYCFGISVITRQLSLLLSTSAILRLLYYSKACLLISYEMTEYHTLTVSRVCLYSLDTLLIFILTHFIFEYMSDELSFDEL